MTTLRGARVTLRHWRDEDVEPFAAMNADPRVMEFLPSPLSREEAAAMIAKMTARLESQGWGHWALDVGGHCIGFIGLSAPNFEAAFTPCIEVGWRLAHEAWGHGYATEGARLALDHGFRVLGMEEIVSFTTIANLRSRKVMERLGMTRDPTEDFGHPRLIGHRLQRHVLYRLPRSRGMS
jgi:RimJ/RimL family protein N-acetyltransferase